MTTREIWQAIQRTLDIEDDGIPGDGTARAVATALGIRLEEPAPIELDGRSLRNLATLDPALVEGAKKLVLAIKRRLAHEGLTYTVISGSRTWEEQDKLYSIGRRGVPGEQKRTNARGGQSLHNYGIAFDGGIFRHGRYLDGSTSRLEREVAACAHRIAGGIAKEHGWEWGGDWTLFPDPPHIQYKTGLTLAQLRERVQAGLPVV